MAAKCETCKKIVLKKTVLLGLLNWRKKKRVYILIYVKKLSKNLIRSLDRLVVLQGVPVNMGI